MNNFDTPPSEQVVPPDGRLTTRRRPRVLVVQENNGMDYSDAERFGDLRFMVAEEFRPLAASLRNQHLLDRVSEAISTFDTENDHLVLTGNPVMMGYAFHLALTKSPTRSLNVLQWDKMSGGYRPVKFFHTPQNR